MTASAPPFTLGPERGVCRYFGAPVGSARRPRPPAAVPGAGSGRRRVVNTPS